MQVRLGETPGSPVAGSRRRARSRRRSGATTPHEGGGNWPVRNAREACSVVVPVRPSGGTRRSRARFARAKATDGASDPGAGAQEPPGARGSEWSEGCPRNWRGPPRPRPAGVGSSPAYNRKREVTGGREGVGGGRSSDDGQDNTTCPERRAPASPMHDEGEEEP